MQDLKENAKKMVTEIQQLQAEGRKKIKLDNLLKYVQENFIDEEAGLSHAEATRLEYQGKLTEYRAREDSRLAQYRADVDGSLEMFKAVIHFAGAALKTLFWLNGGAAVAMLAFLGNIWSKSPHSVIASGITKSLWFFCVGIVVSVICYGFAYLCQVCFTEIARPALKQWLGGALRMITVLLGFGTIWFFYRGIYAVYCALNQHFGVPSEILWF